MNPNYYSRPFEDDDSDDAENKDSSSGPEYKFQGYTIEVNEKIMLTPVTAAKKES